MLSMLFLAVVILILVCSHVAAFMAGANNARRAGMIKEAARSLAKAADSTAKALKKD